MKEERRALLFVIVALWCGMAYGGTISINSSADTNVRDSVITFREALLVANGDLPTGALSAAEMTRLSGTIGANTPDELRFAIGTGAVVINVQTPLPAITDNLGIRGDLQPGFTDKPIVELNGSGTTAGVNGLHVFQGQYTIRSLVINRFGGSGVRVESAASGTIAGCYIGANAAGAAASPNGEAGIAVVGAANNTIGGRNALDRNIVSGNLREGIWIGSGARSNVVLGNYVGTNATGDAAVPNMFSGVVLVDAPENLVGGTGPGDMNLISGNSFDGIALYGECAGSVVAGNYIGTDKTGAIAVRNLFRGIVVVDCPNVVIGGTASGSRNLISGNGVDGIAVFGLNAFGNLIQGNLIGLKADASAALPNEFAGIILSNAPGNVVGGAEPSARNIISGNLIDGVGIYDPGSVGNMVVGNYIGVDLAGLVAIPNAGSGVVVSWGAALTTIEGNVIAGNGVDGVNLGHVDGGHNTVAGNLIGVPATGAADLGNGFSGVYTWSPGNRIGGAADADRNVISGNGVDGVALAGPEAHSNSVMGNYIGTDAAGGSAIGNDALGIRLWGGASNNTIFSNVISGNDGDGIGVHDSATSANLIARNVIGLGADGIAPVPNRFVGILVSVATGTIIGGAAPTHGNVISGNMADGIAVSNGASGTRIEGNIIGLIRTGLLIEGNRGSGILLDSGATGTTVGGTGFARGNVISGNFSNGVTIVHGDTNENVVVGNRIGTELTGMERRPNQGDGVDVGDNAHHNTIGGSSATARNILSGNMGNGVGISGGARNNRITGNYIGLGRDGWRAVGNDGYGVVLWDGATLNDIGGSPAERNIISDNHLDGVGFFDGATFNRVQSNYIGLDAAGNGWRGNYFSGVSFNTDTSDNLVGGTGSGQGNLIHANFSAGIHAPAGVRNTFRGNSLAFNGALGIDLGDWGVNANVPGGSNDGANLKQNYPALTGLTNGNLIAVGSLNAKPNASYIIEFFESNECDPSGHGEGERPIGSATVTTNPQGNVQFAAGLARNVTGLQFVTATATDSQGNTSEFSECLEAPLVGDTNGDGCIDDADLTGAVLDYGTPGGVNGDTDVDDDGEVSDGDITLIILNFGLGCSG